MAAPLEVVTGKISRQWTRRRDNSFGDKVLLHEYSGRMVIQRIAGIDDVIAVYQTDLKQWLVLDKHDPKNCHEFVSGKDNAIHTMLRIAGRRERLDDDEG